MRICGKGWYFESYRHALAAKGIKTSMYRKPLNGYVVNKTRQGIPITVRSPNKTLAKKRAYPISPEQAKERFDKLKSSEVKGITEINFRDPGIPATKQDKAWAQYARSDKRINIFSQPYDGRKFSDVEPEYEQPLAAKNYVSKYILPHEVGHHYYQYNLKLNEDPMLLEEARADAFVAGENALKEPVLKKFIKKRQVQFGEKGTI
jgi:hypothetical protein